MRILALETSTQNGSVALLEQDSVVSETVLPTDRRSAQTLAPAMASLLQQADWAPGSVGLVAVTQGPGSFTGLRIAVTAAKAFAYATRAQLVALDTLSVLVEQLPEDVQHACAVMDAQRRQLFAGLFERLGDASWQTTRSCQVIDRDDLASWLVPQSVLIGPALSRIPSADLAAWRRAAPECWLPRAATVGRLAWRAHQAGQSDDLLRLQPQYYRPSYAEEKKS